MNSGAPGPLSDTRGLVGARFVRPADEIERGPRGDVGGVCQVVLESRDGLDDLSRVAGPEGEHVEQTLHRIGQPDDQVLLDRDPDQQRLGVGGPPPVEGDLEPLVQGKEVGVGEAV